MFAYGQTAANAIAVMSYLAATPSRRVGSAEIANARRISRALTAKLLTRLAAAGLVTGQPGPGGGYTLARNPAEISLFHIASLFEQITAPALCAFGRGWCGTAPALCAFGRGWCGTGAPCPLHEAVHHLQDLNRRFMEETRLSIFLAPEQKNPEKPETPKS